MAIAEAQGVFLGAFRGVFRGVFLGRALKGAVAGLALLGLAACESIEDRIAGHMETGAALVAAGDDVKARLEFATVLQIDADHVGAHLALARLYERAGELRAMVGHLGKVVEATPQNGWAQTRLAEAMLVAGEIDPALRHAEAAVAALPDDPAARAVRAAAYFSTGRSEAALTDARAALAADPAQPLAAQVLVRDRLVAREMEAALALIDGFLVRIPDDFELNRLRLGVLAEIQSAARLSAADPSNPELADPELAAALGAQLVRMTELAPEIPDYWTLLMQWHVQNGDLRRAFEQLRGHVAGVENALMVRHFAQLATRLGEALSQAEGSEATRAEIAALAEAAARPAIYRRMLAALDLAEGRVAAARAALDAMIAGPDRQAANEARVMLARIELGLEGSQTARAAARDTAAALVEAVLADDARNVDALALRTAMALDDGRLEAAQNDLNAALTEAPESPVLLTLMARSRLLAGNRPLAGEALSAAMQAARYAPEETLRYVGFLREEGRIGPAETVLSEAVRLRPDARAMLVTLAELRLELGMTAEAETVAVMLAELDGGGGLAARIRAAALYARRDYTASIAILERLAADPAERDAAMRALVAHYVAAGQPEKAADFLATLRAEEPQNLQGIALSAALAERQGDLTQAEGFLRRLTGIAPVDPRGHALLAAFLHRQDDRPAAEAALTAGLQLIPGNPRLGLMLGAMKEEVGDIDAAIAVYETVLAAEPDALVALNNVVSLTSDHYADDPERLARMREMAAPLRLTQVPHFQDTYGWLLHLEGDSTEALGFLLPAAEALPDNPWVRYHAGMALAAIGQPARARPHLEAALELAGDAPFAPAARVRATLSALEGG